MHPARRKLAGQDGGGLFDRLQAAQLDLMRGDDGTGKPLSCSAALLARVAALRAHDLASVNRILGQQKAERFGPRFLEILQDG